MENYPYMNGAVPQVNGAATNGVVHNGIASNSALYAAVKQAPTAPAVVEPNVNVEPQFSEPEGKVKNVRKSRSGEPETGLAVNLRNFETVIEAVEGWEDAYVAPTELYELEHLTEVQEAVAEAMETERVVAIDKSYAVAVQKLAFDGLKKDCTMAFNYFEVSGATAEEIELARHYNFLLQGRRITKLKGKTLDKPRKSPSRLGYVNQVKNFDLFIKTLEKSGVYTNAQGRITLVAMLAKLAEMRAAVKAVRKTNNQLDNAQYNRDVLMYKMVTGMVFLAYGVKKTALSLFGSRDPRYKQVSKIRFYLPPNYKNL